MPQMSEVTYQFKKSLACRDSKYTWKRDREVSNFIDMALIFRPCISARYYYATGG